MSASAPFFTASWRAGKFTCELLVPTIDPDKPTHCLVEWSPHKPTRPLSGSEQRQYRRGRDAAFAELSTKFAGGPILAVDL